MGINESCLLSFGLPSTLHCRLANEILMKVFSEVEILYKLIKSTHSLVSFHVLLSCNTESKQIYAAFDTD